MTDSERKHRACFLPDIYSTYKAGNVLHRMYKAAGLLFLVMLSVAVHAQSGKPRPVAEKRLQAGYQTQITGWVVHQGDTLQLGRGSRPGKEFLCLYQYTTSAPATPLSRKYLTASYSGYKAILKDMTAQKDRGVESGRYVLLSIKGLPLYRANLDSAINAGEILPPIRYRPSGRASPAVPVIVAKELIKLREQLKAGRISQAEFEARKKKIME